MSGATNIADTFSVATGAVLGFVTSGHAINFGCQTVGKILDRKTNFSWGNNQRLGGACVALFLNIGIDLVEYIVPSTSDAPLFYGN